MGRNWWWWTGPAASLLLSVMGCVSSGTSDRETPLIPARPYEVDIPVPRGFSLVDHAGVDRATGSRRLYLRHVYEGQADKYSVREFYRKQMPLARWSQVSDGNVKGHIEMRFEKAVESCSISITDNVGFWRRTSIQIIVALEEPANGPPKHGNKP